MSDELIQLTDRLGRPDPFIEDFTEPLPGSIVMVGGAHGSAWQKAFSDGKWYCTQRTGGGKTWEWLLTRRNLVMVYDAEERSA